jgi:hypothetical protein
MDIHVIKTVHAFIAGYVTFLPCISSNCMYAVEILFENPNPKTKEL